MKAVYGPYDSYCLSKKLFQCAEPGNELIDFELEDYIRFLDNVLTLEDLILGLSELSPFADDALDIAESMSSVDFSTFKLALVQERRITASLKNSNPHQLTLLDILEEEIVESGMPSKFGALLIPSKFVDGQIIAQKFRVSLVVAMSRIMETEWAAQIT